VGSRSLKRIFLGRKEESVVAEAYGVLNIADAVDSTQQRRNQRLSELVRGSQRWTEVGRDNKR
jgi:hypothetical protein